MGQGAGTHIGDAHHLEYARNMGIAGLALDAVREVEGHARKLTLEHSGHEPLQVCDQFLVPFKGLDLVAELPEPIHNPLNGFFTVFLTIGKAEQIDDFFAFTVKNYGDFHCFPSLRTIQRGPEPDSYF